MKILQPKQSLKSPIWAEKPKSGNTASHDAWDLLSGPQHKYDEKIPQM